MERYRGRVPDEVFTQVYRAPKTDGSGWPRDNLGRAFALLAKAGWVVRDMKMVNAETGKRLKFEILLYSPAFERIVLPFKRNLARLGIDARVRLVDTSQYINRLREFDFDIIVASWGQSESPGNEQRSYWSSQAAAAPGARNYIGIKDPVVETPRTVRDRIARAVDVLGEERVRWVHPDCGFWMLTPETADGKMRALGAGRDLYLGRA